MDEEELKVKADIIVSFMFSKYDKDKNGFLDKAEFREKVLVDQ